MIIIFMLLTYNLSAFDVYMWGNNYVKWNKTIENPVIYWTLHPDIPENINTTQEELETMISNALAEWNAVPESYLELQQNDPDPPLDTDEYYREGYIVMRFVEQNELSCGTAAAGCGGCVLADSNGYCIAGTLQILSSENITEYTASFNRVAIHEVGHTIGLGHSDKNSVMSYHRGSSSVTIDDRMALGKLYPAYEGDGYNLFSCASIHSDRHSKSSGNISGFISFFIMYFSPVFILRLIRKLQKNQPM